MGPPTSPLIINKFGHVNANFTFDFETELMVYHSCGLTWQNEHYVFGGTNDGGVKQRNKVARIDTRTCRLEIIKELNFPMTFVACATMGTEIYLCFGRGNPSESKTCHKSLSPLGEYTELAPTEFYHRMIRIAASHGERYLD